MEIQKTSKPMVLKFFSRTKNFFRESNLKLKTLIKDTFCREKTIISDEKIHVPEFLSHNADFAGTTVQDVKFYPEDIKKMRGMTLEGVMRYKKLLIESGRYSIE